MSGSQVLLLSFKDEVIGAVSNRVNKSFFKAIVLSIEPIHTLDFQFQTFSL